MPGKEASQDEDIAAGQQALPELRKAGVTAVFCYNDMIAIGTLMACQQAQIAVPQQLSVVGFDDITMASCVMPALTTVRQPKAELGRLATEVMLDLLQNRPGNNHILQPTLTLRASTSPPGE